MLLGSSIKFLTKTLAKFQMGSIYWQLTLTAVPEMYFEKSKIKTPIRTMRSANANSFSRPYLPFVCPLAGMQASSNLQVFKHQEWLFYPSHLFKAQVNDENLFSNFFQLNFVSRKYIFCFLTLKTSHWLQFLQLLVQFLEQFIKKMHCWPSTIFQFS